MNNVKPSDRATLVGVVNPQSATTVQTSGWIAAKDFGSFLATVIVGAITATGTVDAKLQQASDASGTGAKDITGKSITQLTAAGTDSNKQVEINLYPEELDLENNFTHFRLSITPATAAAVIAGTVRGLAARYQPAADASTVDEVVG